MSPDTRETVFWALIQREADLNRRIETWSRRGAKLPRAEKDKLIAMARGELTCIAAARAELKRGESR